MWKHEILECIKYTNSIYTAMERAGVDTRYKYMQQPLYEATKTAQVFFFGDRNDSIVPAAKTLKNQSFKLPLKTPYDQVIYEYKCENPDYSKMKAHQHHSSKRAVLIFTTPVNTQLFFSLNYIEDINKWDFPIVFYEVNEQHPDNWCGNFHCFVKPGSHPSLSDEVISGFAEELREEICACATMTSILNCQNVITKEVLPPETLNKKRIKHGKAPLYSYKILEVVKGKPKTKDAGTVPWDYKSPEAVRFHLCRGHFKTFTEDKPLFGKYAGTFWWNPQSRGDRNKGVVEKEYSVKIA